MLIMNVHDRSRGFCYGPAMRRLFCLAAMLFASSAHAQQDARPFVVGSTGIAYARLQDAVAAIGDGSGTIFIAPGTYHECAVQAAGGITYRALTPGTVLFDGGICEGKAALVLRGRAAKVDGIIFEHMTVADGNGAGIRLERGDLSVENSVFRDSQEGLLTGSDPAGSITILRSTFSGLGRCDGGLDCAHSLYVGDYASLSVQHCRFEAGTGGHYVKSRARRVRIVDNSFDDSQGRATNYMIDLPNGALGEISGNEMVQGADKDNYSSFIALGAEGAQQSSDGLSIGGNGARFVPGVDRRSAFVADWTGARLAIGQNTLSAGIMRYERR